MRFFPHILLLLLTTITCRKGDEPCLTCPPPYVQTVFLDTLSVDVTEVLLRVRGTDTSGAVQLSLYRDSLLLFTGQPTRGDTTVLDTSLAPARLYTYKAYRLTPTSSPNIGTSSGQAGQPANQPTDSTQLAVRTMDTTGHNFTWQIDSLGDGSSSALRDVAIVGENDVWAAGELYLRDSSGQIDPIPYNASHWDGSQWSLLRVPVPIFCGSVTFPSATQAVFAFGQNDVWIASGITIMRWNGTTFSSLCIPQNVATGTINKIWGESPNSVYCVGNNGTIAHFDGATWQRVESGTTVDVSDIFGNADPVTGALEVLAVAGNPFVSSDRRIFQITGNMAVMLSDSGINWALTGVWFVPNRYYWVVGDGIYYKKRSLMERRWSDLSSITNYLTYTVRGNAINDVFICGAFGEFLHFNGVTWRSFRPQVGLQSGRYSAVAVNGQHVIAIGREFAKAVVTRGTR